MEQNGKRLPQELGGIYRVSIHGFVSVALKAGSCLPAVDILHYYLGTTYIDNHLCRDEFSELLNERHPVSLLIYIHWCAIMHRAPNRWFLNGWARRAATAAALHLGPQWDEFLEWPRTVLATELKAYSSEEMMGVAVILHVADDRVSC